MSGFEKECRVTLTLAILCVIGGIKPTINNMRREEGMLEGARKSWERQVIASKSTEVFQ